MSARSAIASVFMACGLTAAAAVAQTPPARRPATPPAAAPTARQTPADSAAADSSLRIEYRREIYNYRGGSRDPFHSLVTSNDVRPTVADLRVVSIAYDARGGNSVAVVRETNNPRVHRLRRGDQIGRLRVIQIRQYEVVFQVEEFGFERQEVLTLSRPEAMR